MSTNWFNVTMNENPFLSYFSVLIPVPYRHYIISVEQSICLKDLSCSSERMRAVSWQCIGRHLISVLGFEMSLQSKCTAMHSRHSD